MKKFIFISIITVFCLTVKTYSQFTFQRTSDPIIYQSPDSLEATSWATVTNTSSGVIPITIDISVLSAPPGYADSLIGFCTWNNCYPPGLLHQVENCSVGAHPFDIYVTIYNHAHFYVSVRVTMTYQSTSVTQDFGLSTFPVGISPISTTVSEFKLNQNYPNPFNPSTKIGFSIPKNDLVDLRVYDILGREVAVILSGFMSAGEYEVEFDAKNLASGIYYYRFKTPEFVTVKKMTLVK